MTIVLEYVYWQYVRGPRWLAAFFWNVQRYLWLFFSVPFMVRTLFAYWRKDSVGRAGALDQLLMSYVWNGISRGIGCIVRTTVLIAYVVASLGAALLSVGSFVVFLLWPVLVVLAALGGLGLLLGGGK